MSISPVHQNRHSHEVHRGHHKKHHKEQQHVNADSVSLGGQQESSPGKELQDMKRELGRASQAEKAPPLGTTSVDIAGKEKVTIGTFNVNWLGGEAAVDMKPRSDRDYQDIASIIKDSGADIMGLEEVGSEEALDRIISNLPGFDYVIGTTGVRGGGKSQRLAVIYNAEKVQCDKSSMEEIREVMVPELAGEGRLRAPLAVKMKAGEFDFTLVVCHMKARFDDKAKKIRSAQAGKLNEWITEKVQSGKEKDVIVVGDFNDFLDSPPLKKMDSQIYFVTQEAARKGEASNIKWNSLIDQIGVTSRAGGAKENFIERSVFLPDIGPYPSFVERISDHRPVVASFRSDSDAQ
ncbi:MAG: endonuclease/exonuclease/phosphatase family protein [Candidatus Eremiobacteraeota bacterium]|nr:endonuclease/exonuclease/phosphatase family protein [Candidatus Eremiobacteraeota bacterium]